MAGTIDNAAIELSAELSAAESCAYTSAQLALARSPIYALRQLIVAQTDESLVLSGTVGSYYEKQQAQEIVRSSAGSREVINQIAVNDL
jgi:osmotically-inducible protein OsmY